jgi:hypothetical protein
VSDLMLFLGAAGTLLAFVVGAGLLVLAFREPPARSPDGSTLLARLDPRPVFAQRRKLLATLAAGIATGAASGWPVAGVAAAAAVWFAPVLLGTDPGEAGRIERMESIAIWAEMLRDTLSSAAGLEQAVLASTNVAPDAIAGPLAMLRSDLHSRRPFAEAMADLARTLADPTADQVVDCLVYAQTNQAKNLSELLGELATAARAQVTLAVRVHAERSQHRSAQRSITGIFTTMAVGLAAGFPKFLAPYDTAAGQLVMAVELGVFAACLAWMRAIVRPKPPVRLLAPDGWTEAGTR